MLARKGNPGPLKEYESKKTTAEKRDLLAKTNTHRFQRIPSTCMTVNSANTASIFGTSRNERTLTHA
eukprot:3930420-Pyramimonas_sp.AAC.1